jgi:hypothetical protein
MYFAAWAPLMADRTWDFQDWKLLLVSFSVTGMKERPRNAATACAEEEGSAMTTKKRLALVPCKIRVNEMTSRSLGSC